MDLMYLHVVSQYLQVARDTKYLFIVCLAGFLASVLGQGTRLSLKFGLKSECLITRQAVKLANCYWSFRQKAGNVIMTMNMNRSTINKDQPNSFLLDTGSSAMKCQYCTCT